ncbi:MAG TPA: ABC transporter permease [Anaerolineales bacterium]|nr:ABC transporter permease [Anaerolineales bacterium]
MNVRLTKILRDLWVNKSRSVLIVLAIAVGVAAFGLMISGRIMLESNLSQAYSASHPAQSVLVVQSFDDALLSDVRGLSYVQNADARLVTQARLEVGTGPALSLELTAVPDFHAMNLNRFTPFNQAPAADSILLERSLNNIAATGNAVRVQLLDGSEHTLKVSGFVNDLSQLPSDISLTAYGYITTDTAKTLGLPSGYDQLYVTFKNASARTDIEQNLTKLINDIQRQGYAVYSAPVPAPNKYALGDNMNSVLFILGALGGLTLLLSAFLVTSVMSAVITQQIPQIGILKSLGARIHQAITLYLFEVLIFGICALILAVPMGLIGSYFLATGVASGMNFDVTQFSLPPLTLLLQAASALLVPLMASLFPILTGSRITIREAINSNSMNAGAGGATRLGGFSQLMNLSFRNTFRRKGRLALTFAALVLAGSMFIAVIGIRQSMRDAVKQIQGDTNYNINLDFVQPYPAADIQNQALSVSGVKSLETWSIADGRVFFNQDWLSGSVIIYGVPSDTQMAKPGVNTGRWLNASDKYAIFVNADFLDLAPGFHTGSPVKLRIAGQEHDWTIVGTGARGFVPQAFVHLDDLSAQTGLVNLANRLVVITNTSTPDFEAAVQSDLLKRYSADKMTVAASETTTQLKQTTAQQMDTLIILLMSMVILIAVVGGLGLAITMGLNVLERTREIGILRSLGAQTGVVRRVVILEGLVIALISWALAIPVSIPLAVYLGNALGVSLLDRPLDYVFSWQAVGIWLALIVMIAVVASLIPAQNAARLTIRDTLVYE